MTLEQRIKASAEELGKLLREAEREHQCRMAERDMRMSLDNGKAVERAQAHGLDPRNSAASDRSKALLEAAENIDKQLQAYSARDAFRVVEICKVLVTARCGAI